MLLLALACAVPDPQNDDSGRVFVDDGCVHPLWEGAWPFPNDRLVTHGAGTLTRVELALDESLVPMTRNDAPALDPAWFDGVDGFSRVGPAVVQLDTPVDPTQFPEVADADAPVFLVDVYEKTVIPGRLSVTDDGRTIAVWPDEALRPGALHALVLTDALPTGTCFSAGPAMDQAENADDPLSGEMQDARSMAEEAGFSPAAVVPFTTRSAEGESAAMTAIAASNAGLDATALSVGSVTDCAVASTSGCAEGVAFVVTGTAALPTWQSAADGTFVEEGGVPVQQGTEDVEFWLLVPDAARTSPPPFLVLQHGLGGSKEGMIGFGERLAADGYAVAAIDAVSHGSRPHDGDTTMGFFGIDYTQWKVARARDNIRQTAADHMALRTVLAAATAEDGRFDGQDFYLDAEDAGYVGQSLGGIIGATSCATDTGLDRCVLNVPGGRLIEVVRANVAYATLLNIYFDPEDDDSEVELFSAMAQIVVDPADPALAGRRILAEAPARPVLVQEATQDEVVYNQTTELLARSMGIPLLDPSLEEIRGIDHADLPVQANFDGGQGAVTAGLAQFEAGHGFLLESGEEPERAIRQILTFLDEDRITSGNE